jgi:hypothetical protein
MPALAKCTPIELKDILIAAGWRVYNEDPYNWSMVRGIGSESVGIPRKGKLVSFQVLYHCLGLADLAPGDYFELLAKVQQDHRANRRTLTSPSP